MSKVNRILYIDDDSNNRETVSRALTLQGHIVHAVRTGQEGIDSAEQERPDVILLDMILADMTGFDVCEYIRSNPRLKRIPIIGISASAINSNLQRSLNASFDAYLAKPIARLELANTIDRFAH